MKTVIMAGGKGTRIQSISADIPKPMIRIGGIPVLEREIMSLREQGFDDIIITVSHLGPAIMDYFRDGSDFGVSIEYFVEEQPLGNAGALLLLREKLGDEPFLLINGDLVFDVDFKRMLEFHKKHGAKVTLFTHPNSHPYDSALLVTDENDSVAAWLTKEEPRPQYYKNCVNAGLHILEASVLDECGIDKDRIGKPDEETGKPVKLDLDRQLLKPLAGSGKMFAYQSPEYVRDMGTPERFYAVQKDVLSGRVSAASLVNRQKAVFLDRDGTLNKYVGFLRNIDEFELLKGVGEAIKLLNNSGFLCIVVTNQPVIARGEVSEEQLQQIHNKMETELGREGAFLNAIYYCPHHPDSGFPGEIPELKIKCSCRKPAPGMLLRAAEDYNIDLAESWMVGDSLTDVRAGRAAGCRTVLLGQSSEEADVCAASLLEFVKTELVKDKEGESL